MTDESANLPAWFNAAMPWEEPSRAHPIRRWRWRRRHERIFWLERRLGLHGRRPPTDTPMPWVDDYGWY